MAEEGYKTTTVYQTRIALYNMLEFARENDVILTNPCKKSVKSDMGKPSEKKEAPTLDVHKKFLEAVVGEWRVGPPKSQSGYRTITVTG
jgi:integrase